jgi:hypothetical protein
MATSPYTLTGTKFPPPPQTLPNVSICRLQPGNFYRYFVSPDNKVVIFEPGTRRVARIVSRAG